MRAYSASTGWLLLLLIYVSAFWGRAGLLLPAPFDNWHYIIYRALVRWSDGARQLLRAGENTALYSGVEAFLVGLILPALFLSLLLQRVPSELGLRRPDATGWRWAAAVILLAIPVGFWITGLVPPQGSDLRYTIRLLTIIPEHFLIFGVGVALLLPGRRLPVQTAREDRSLSGTIPFSPASLFAICGSTVLFVAVHVGAKPVELAFSIPAGAVFAYVTWRTASIWPAVFAHWALNLVPMGFRALPL